MREILFRGKRLDNGEWVEGDFIHTATYPKRAWITECKIVFDGQIRDIGIREVDPATVGQYIGLEDKKGTKIFKGDIVKAKDETGITYRFEVKFGKCGGVQNVLHDVGYLGFCFEEIINVPSRLELRTDPLYWLNEYACEVIGNIHDNDLEANQT